MKKDYDHDALVAALRAGASCRKAAALFGVSPALANKVGRRAGVPFVPRGRPRRHDVKPGDTFGDLTVESFAVNRAGRTTCACRCACGRPAGAYPPAALAGPSGPRRCVHCNGATPDRSDESRVLAALDAGATYREAGAAAGRSLYYARAVRIRTGRPGRRRGPAPGKKEAP